MIDNLSIVIPTLNEQKYLPKLLSSITTQNVLPKHLQVIVVDGESDDKTIEVARSFKYKFKDLSVIKSKRGVGYQRNIGAKNAKYDHILLLMQMLFFQNIFFKNYCQR